MDQSQSSYWLRWPPSHSGVATDCLGIFFLLQGGTSSAKPLTSSHPSVWGSSTCYTAALNVCVSSSPSPAGLPTQSGKVFLSVSQLVGQKSAVNPVHLSSMDSQTVRNLDFGDAILQLEPGSLVWVVILRLLRLPLLQLCLQYFCLEFSAWPRKSVTTNRDIQKGYKLGTGNGAAIQRHHRLPSAHM